jgi:7-keto-8-aminopelargonate synthetase-like enzyme
MKSHQQILHNQLVERQENGLVRSLISVNHLVDFCSNDYLGLAKNPSLADKIDADFKANIFIKSFYHYTGINRIQRLYFDSSSSSASSLT